MRNWKYGVIIVLLIILMGVIIFSMRAKPQKKAVSQPSGLANDPPISEVVKDSSPKQVEAPTNSAPVYLTQEQQDSRQHKWGKPNLPEVDAACLHGAEAKVTLRVIDSGGKPVPEAEVKVAFSPRDPNEAGKNITGLTDKESLFVATGKTTYDVSYSASKTNYYLTVRNFPFYWQGTECVKDGRWQPWNPTLEVVLKEKRKPIPMLTKRVELTFPKRIAVGFDVERGDLVTPYGKGINTNIIFKYTSTFSRENIHYITNDITLSTYRRGGFIQLKLEQYSRKENVYEAPTEGYRDSLTFELVRWPGKIIKDVSLPKQSYLVFKTNEAKNSARFGIIRDFEYGECWEQPNYCTVIFMYYFNPTPTDGNLSSTGRTICSTPIGRTTCREIHKTVEPYT